MRPDSATLARRALKLLASCLLLISLNLRLDAQIGSGGIGGSSNPLAIDSEAVNSGKEAFAAICSACHGSNAEGGQAPSLTDNDDVRSANDQDLFHIIRNGVPGTAMPAFPFPEQKIWQIVAYIRSLNAPAIESSPPGDPQLGQGIFFGKGGCSTCHMIRGKGGFQGPDLSNAGSARTTTELRQALLQPNAHPQPGFQAVTTITRSGEKIDGVAKSYTNYSVDILDARGELHLLWMRDLKKITFEPKSLMPDDYARRLTPEEITNVLAFLSRQSMSGRAEK